MPDLVVGIDPSSKSIALVAKHPVTPTGMVWKGDIAGRERYKPEHAAEAMYQMQDVLGQVATMATGNIGRVAYVESPLIGRGGAKTTMVQSFVNGVIQACLIQCGFQVYMVNVSTWKAAVCGNGAADKADVQRLVKARWPSIGRACGSDQDKNDAAAICLYGEDVRRKAAGLLAGGSRMS